MLLLEWLLNAVEPPGSRTDGKRVVFTVGRPCASCCDLFTPVPQASQPSSTPALQ